MKISDFSIEFQQKFDFGGKPYKFSKVDIDSNTLLSSSLLGNFVNQSADYNGNVMVISSDQVLFKGNNYITKQIDEGEVIYMSTLIDKLNSAGSEQPYFGNVLDNTSTSGWQVPGSRNYVASKRAGTFYIFDFNDNPIDLNSK